MPTHYETIAIVLFHGVLAPLTALHALLYKRDPRAAFGWIAVCVLFPLFGPILYLFFGLNRARGRAQKFDLGNLTFGYERGRAIDIRFPLPDSVRAEYRKLAHVGQALSRYPLCTGNAGIVLENGEAAFPEMVEAIDRAESHVLLTTYILDTDRSGEAFQNALARARERGVRVRVLIDGFGDWYSHPRASRALARAGIEVARFRPPALFPPSLSLNMRNHHKILVADGATGFTGGMNISDRHCLDDPGRQRPTADLHFRLAGPIVGQLQAEFLRMWHFTTGREEDFPVAPEKSAGNLDCRTVTDGPDEDLDRLTMLLIAAIAEARESVRILTPYFLPPRELIGAIQAAVVRGVDVTIVLPAENNLPFVHWATRNMLWEVLFRGAKVFYQPPPFNHAKLFVVDGYYSLIGSTNWDPRSLRLNFELQVEIYGEAFATGLIDYIDTAAARGRAVTLDEVDGRRLPERLRDSACWLFSPYL